MNDFENELDRIRIELYERTKEMDKKDIIENVNSHAHKIAQEFGIIIKNRISEEYFYTVNA
jgi:hypothetical protein